MDLLEIRQMLRTKGIFNTPLRVTYYARVSSDSDEQLNSLGNQISYYENFIKKNECWTFVEGYIDEGISGISTKHRENFNRMIEDAERKKFDLIITQKVSNISKKPYEVTLCSRLLATQKHPIGIYFVSEDIFTSVIP